MIVHHCDKCGQDFSDDGDYQQHKILEETRELVNMQAENLKKFASYLGNIEFAINLQTAHIAMWREHLSFADASKLLLERHFAFNIQVMDFYRAKQKELKETEDKIAAEEKKNIPEREL